MSNLRLRLGILAATLPLLAAPLFASPSEAVVAKPAAVKPAPKPEPLTSVGSVTVETFADDGDSLLSTETYGPETEGQLMGEPADPSPTGDGGMMTAMDSGTGGSTTASGCRKVTVNNRAHTLLGFTAYVFHTWTRWCWTRSTQTVSDVTTGWTISDVDSQEFWKGIVNSELGFYDYSVNDGHPRSAYKHYRQGQFENCVVKYSCIGTTYPANTLRSYYNGTWAWSTDN